MFSMILNSFATKLERQINNNEVQEASATLDALIKYLDSVTGETVVRFADETDKLFKKITRPLLNCFCGTNSLEVHQRCLAIFTIAFDTIDNYAEQFINCGGPSLLKRKLDNDIDVLAGTDSLKIIRHLLEMDSSFYQLIETPFDSQIEPLIDSSIVAEIIERTKTDSHQQEVEVASIKPSQEARSISVQTEADLEGPNISEVSSLEIIEEDGEIVDESNEEERRSISVRTSDTALYSKSDKAEDAAEQIKSQTEPKELYQGEPNSGTKAPTQSPVLPSPIKSSVQPSIQSPAPDEAVQEGSLDTSIATQGGCRGCDVFTDDVHDSRNFMKLMTNNLTICPTHRYICLALTKHLKRCETHQRATRASLVGTPYRPHLKRTHDSMSSVRRSLARQEAKQVPCRLKVPFALAEDRRLKRGVAKYGVGSWETIRSIYLFVPARTSEDLQTRWEEMLEAEDEEL